MSQVTSSVNQMEVLISKKEKLKVNNFFNFFNHKVLYKLYL